MYLRAPTDQQSRGGAAALRHERKRGHARGRRVGEEGGDQVHEGEDAAQSLSKFEVDRNPSKMMAREMNLLRELYQIPDFVEFKLPGQFDQPTRPPPHCVAVYRDYFLKGL